MKKTCIFLALLAAAAFLCAELRPKAMTCKSLNGFEQHAVSGTAFLIDRFETGDTLSVCTFRNLATGYKDGWSINTGYRRGDTLYSRRAAYLGDTAMKPVFVAEDVMWVVVADR